MKKFLKILFTILLVITLFSSAVAMLLLSPIRRNINEKVVKKMFSSFNIEEEVQNNPNFKKTIDETLEPIYDVTREVGIEDEVVLKILDTKEVKELIGDVSNNLLDTIITGENKKILTKENIDTILNDALDNINQTGTYEIKEETKTEIINIVDEEVSNVQELIPNTNTIIEQLDKEDAKYLEGIRYLLSPKLYTYIILTLIFSCLGIVLLNLKHFKWLKIISITALVSAILIGIITSFLYLLNITYVEPNNAFIYLIINRVVKTSYLYSGSIFILTIILLIIYRIIRKKSYS